MCAEEACRIIQAEYYISPEYAVKHLKAYHESLLKKKKICKSKSADLLGISRITLNKILKADPKVSYESLRTFLNGLKDTGCPVPDTISPFDPRCENCIHHLLGKTILNVIKST